MNVLTGHDPATNLDLLLEVHEDGTHRLATRPGRAETDVTWSPPVELVAARAEVAG